jgi:Peptidase family M28
MIYYVIPITIVLGGIVVAMTLLRRWIKSNSNNPMTKSIFLILIIIFASLPNTIGVSAANENTNGNMSNDYNQCIFSIIIICWNDLFQQESEETAATDEVSISSIVDQVNSTKLKKWVDDLSSFHTRHTKTEYIEKVAYWLKNELQSVCKGRVYFDNFTQIDQRTSYNLKNVICNQEGGSTADDHNNHLILISAHYDSRMQDINQTNARAPGADDNASGVAAVLELARVLSKVDLKSNIQFVLFSGEEQGQWGSRNYAKHLHDNNNIKIDLLINLDMIGYPPQGSNKVAIEYDLGNRVLVNDRYSYVVAEFIKHIALEYTNLEAVLASLGKSDYTPFESFGYTVIGIHDEGSELNPNYHSSSDTPDTLDIGYLSSTTKLVLATILKLDELSQ